MKNIDYNKEPYTTFKKMYIEEGLSMRKIAELNKCSVCKIQKFLEKFNITRTLTEAKSIQGKDILKNSFGYDKEDFERKEFLYV